MTELWLIVVSVVLTLALGLLVLLWRQLRQFRVQLQIQQQSIQNCSDDLVSLCAAAVVVDRNLSQFEERLSYLAKPAIAVDRESHPVFDEPPQTNESSILPSTTADSVESGYQNAIQKIHQGAQVDELVKSCGLTRDEALLLIRVHGR